MFNKLLVAYDGSPESRKALQAGIDMAKCTGASLSTITVEEGLPPYLTAVGPYGVYSDVTMLEDITAQRGAYYAGLQKEAADFAREAGIELCCSLVTGSEVSSIVDHARHVHCDLLLVGYHAHSVLSDRFLGSTAHAISMAAPCSVMSVK
ncbi:MAG: universal stress protein [Capsulimonadaceae bacterium]